uniref:Uncharacterized protein n=1 Tax=Chromera velia CCMP2878 TaxID=1169474 RepID=A0A0G4I3I9_9ALVE|eukprot:Cvel_1752.t1-p1 / transcript=Cvel_1752.t1 / gene=Cvel_1752 / organism=Chromera_velia_CCMP2878 / gene_product=hypothetical protein / transcript_product=hypothetical protein / location=Cvel_scaffold64:37909-38250(-) / protein_length=114 / sequence_SO=supercontig / SO=protein_coding / is_pseudo=false
MHRFYPSGGFLFPSLSVEPLAASDTSMAFFNTANSRHPQDEGELKESETRVWTSLFAVSQKSLSEGGQYSYDLLQETGTALSLQRGDTSQQHPKQCAFNFKFSVKTNQIQGGES